MRLPKSKTSSIIPLVLCPQTFARVLNVVGFHAACAAGRPQRPLRSRDFDGSVI